MDLIQRRHSDVLSRRNKKGINSNKKRNIDANTKKKTGASLQFCIIQTLANILLQLEGSIHVTQFSYFAFGKSHSHRYFSKNVLRLAVLGYSVNVRRDLIDNSIKIYRPPSLAPFDPIY